MIYIKHTISGKVFECDLTSVEYGDYLIHVINDAADHQNPASQPNSLSLVAPVGVGDTAVPNSEAEAAQDQFDPTKKFVRITGIQQNRLIEFDFSVGEPELYIELVLPFQAFQDFCATNKVQYLTAEQAAAVDYDRLKWRSGSPGIEHDETKTENVTELRRTINAD